jgi:nicotinamidase-related amidase
MNTKFNEIVSIPHIGLDENPINMNNLLSQADTENLRPHFKDTEKVMLLIIDMQRDFMENGSLPVPNSHKDVENLTRFMYNHMEKLSRCAMSLDTHKPYQIFHPAWWVDQNGNHPAPYTAITLADIDAGKWFAVVNPKASRIYVENLEKLGKKVLVIWTYHCLQGTVGASLENQLSNMLMFHTIAKKNSPVFVVKGQDPFSEMYGIIKPEYDTNNFYNLDLLNEIAKYDKIVIAGEAKSHCVLESIKQVLDHYSADLTMTRKFWILEDCMSSITSYEVATDQTFDDFKKKYHVNIVKSTDDFMN